MHEAATSLERLDGQILHALQIWPRVSWSSLGSLLNIDAATASRHWARLHEAGVAWFTAYPLNRGQIRTHSRSLGMHANLVSAVVELRVSPNRLSRVFGQLQELQELQVIRSTLGEWNISMDWRSGTIEELAVFVNQRLAQIDGVLATRSFAVTHTPIEGSTWRYGGLSPEQEVQLRRLQRQDLTDPVPFTEYWHPIDDSLIALIQQDARMSTPSLRVAPTRWLRRSNGTWGICCAIGIW